MFPLLVRFFFLSTVLTHIINQQTFFSPFYLVCFSGQSTHWKVTHKFTCQTSTSLPIFSVEVQESIDAKLDVIRKEEDVIRKEEDSDTRHIYTSSIFVGLRCANAGCTTVETRQGEFQACGRCGLYIYCSPACQKNHWKVQGHRESCK